jgi:hypothetical protein
METKMVVVDTGRFAYGSRIPRNRLAKPLVMHNLRQDPAPRRTKTVLRNYIILPAPSALTVKMIGLPSASWERPSVWKSRKVCSPTCT